MDDDMIYWPYAYDPETMLEELRERVAKLERENEKLKKENESLRKVS